MTITIGFVRHTGRGMELILASDSRLRSGGAFNAGQKVFVIPGLNAGLAFAGDTITAYPMIQHLISSAENYPSARDGAMDITEFVPHLKNLMTSLLGQFNPEGDDSFRIGFAAGARFLFGGHSFRTGTPHLWTIGWHPATDQFEAEEVPLLPFSRTDSEMQIAVIGDYSEAYDRIVREVCAGREDYESWEPIWALFRLLRAAEAGRATPDDPYRLIGGAPQMIKFYPSRTFRPYAIRWGDPPALHLGGRRLMGYEKTLWPIYESQRQAPPYTTYPLRTISN